MNKFYLCIKAIFVLFAIAALQSCSDSPDELLETVPASARFTADIDLPEVLKGLGVNFNNNSVEVPENAVFIKQIMGDDFREKLPLIHNAFNTKHFIIFQWNGNIVSTLRVSDKDALDRLLQSKPFEKKNGYKIYTNENGMTILLKGNQFWALNSNDAVGVVEDILKDAKQANMASHQGLSDFLERENAACIVSNINGIGTADQWACLAMVINDNRIIFNAQVMETTGEVVNFENLQTLQTDVLRYIPANMNLVGMMGATKKTNWEILDKIIDISGIDRLGGFLDTFMPYLKSADGTVAVAAHIDAEEIMDSGADFLIMIHLPMDKIKEGLNEVERQIVAAGGTPHRDAQGNISMNAYGMSLYAAAVDGYLGIATFPFSPTRNNELAPYFVNRQAGIYLNLPAIPMLDDAPGIIADFQMQQAAASLSLECPQGLVSLMNFIAALTL